MKKAILILGATSSLARSVAAEFAAKGYPLFLAARDETELVRLAQDFRIRYGIEVRTGCFNADSCGGHDLFIQHVIKQVGGFEGAVLGFGYKGNHAQAIQNFAEAEPILLRNFIGACSLLSRCAAHLERQGHGFIIGISSAAGDRGLYSNYYYAAAMAGLTLFLQGLRHRLFHVGVHVLTVKPGWIKALPPFGIAHRFFALSPEQAGRKIVTALERGRNRVYIPGYWRGLMMGIKCIPEVLLKRFKF